MIYVMSDIHGNKKRFDSIMKQINLQPEDTLYILGDVVDRYKDGIGILKQIMKMPNVKMLIGNHEYMMLNAIGHCKDAADEVINTNFRERRNWYSNGGRITHQYLKRQRKNVRAEIFEYIRNLPTNIDVEVNGIKYKLVHASPIENFTISYLNAIYYRDEKEFAVWERWSPSDKIPENYILIFGHTPTAHFQLDYPFAIWYGDNAIGIDCGSGYDNGRLACLRLDDMKEFYSKEEE